MKVEGSIENLKMKEEENGAGGSNFRFDLFLKMDL